MSAFLGSRIADLWMPNDGFRLCLKSTDLPVAIEHREAAIALVRRRPEAGNVVARRLGSCAHAPVCRTRRRCPVRNSLGIPCARGCGDARRALGGGSAGHMDSPRGPIPAIFSTASSSAVPAVRSCPAIWATAIRASRGRGGIVDEVEEDLWLVAHADERHRPEVRRHDRPVVQLLRRTQGAALRDARRRIWLRELRIGVDCGWAVQPGEGGPGPQAPEAAGRVRGRQADTRRHQIRPGEG